MTKKQRTRNVDHTATTVIWRNIQSSKRAAKNCSQLEENPHCSPPKEERVTPPNEAVIFLPALGNCSTVYQSRRSVVFPANSFDFYAALEAPTVSADVVLRKPIIGRDIKRQKQPAFWSPHSNERFLAIGLPGTESLQPEVSSGNLFRKSVRHKWNGGGSMQVLKAGNWCRALGLAERNHSWPPGKALTGPCKACANVWELDERRVWDSKSERGRNHDALWRFAYHYVTLLRKQSHNDGSNVNNSEMPARVHGPGHVVLATCVYSAGGVFMKFAKKAASNAFANETYIHLLLRRDFFFLRQGQ